MAGGLAAVMRSWGGLPEHPQRSRSLNWRDELAECWDEPTLAVGAGRSYGDCGLAASGEVLCTTGMNRMLQFDQNSGVLRCEAGVSLGDILRHTVPAGWILPVLPGTQYVTVAGAIANDVHGKNHHGFGTFGRHVKSLLLQRSDRELIECSAGNRSEWFSASIAGLGLTGVILQAELQLKPVAGAWLQCDTVRFRELAEFFALSEESDQNYEYTVAWIDCLHARSRGIFSRAWHIEDARPAPLREPRFRVPFTPPLSPVNRFTLRAFNSLYYHRQRLRGHPDTIPLGDWFFPLDSIGSWNRLYGSRGFRQYQCVVPAPVVRDLLAIIRRSAQGSFLAVLKTFGDLQSPGLMSFPRPGVTLALDFPWRGSATLELFAQLDAVVGSNDGAIYPAKDAHMQGADFRRAYPAWETVERLRDPRLKSLLWQRVTEDS
ncbi:MAG: FAD-binding oxidoreductase [Gammaproteobacteria bacterium]|nr:FAD-binding oxidoreductase [Gammaproteobacteria bacterium]